MYPTRVPEKRQEHSTVTARQPSAEQSCMGPTPKALLKKKAAERSRSTCPFSVTASSPLVELQTFAVWSSDAIPTEAPSQKSAETRSQHSRLRTPARRSAAVEPQPFVVRVCEAVMPQIPSKENATGKRDPRAR